jgi:tRNA-2-methylthio-N6-dimethylallyladenosine synthase
MNVHDSERLEGLLQQAGYEATTDVGDADIVVINTCTVRERAEDKLYARLDEVARGDRATRPVVVVTGCVAPPPDPS